MTCWGAGDQQVISHYLHHSLETIDYQNFSLLFFAFLFFIFNFFILKKYSSHYGNSLS